MSSIRRLLLTLSLALFASSVFAADLSITAANVRGTATTVYGTGTAGATITAGQLLYLDSTTGTLKLSQTDGTAVESVAVGIAMHAASANQPLKYAKGGAIKIGATVSLGKEYIGSTTAGGVAPIDDAASTQYQSHIGSANATDELTLHIYSLQVQRAADVT